MAFESKLGLSLAELKPFYTRHLLLSEIVTCDVSLAILSLCFLAKRVDAVKSFLSVSKSDTVQELRDTNQERLSLLWRLEDRGINGVILFMLGKSCMGIEGNMRLLAHQFYTSGYHILKARRNVLDAEELFYLGNLCEVEKTDQAKDLKEAFLCYQQSGDLGYPEAYTRIAVSYYRGDGVEGNIDNAVIYFEKAISLHSVRAMNFLATLLSHGLGVPKDVKRANALLEEAASYGDPYAAQKLIKK